MSSILNKIRAGMYLDSVALMRMSRSIADTDGVEEAALMMGTPANLEIMSDAGLLDDAGRTAGPSDLVIAIRAKTDEIAQAVLATAETELDAPSKTQGDAATWSPKTLRSAVTAMPDANLALISVPGDFAASEARKAIRRGLNAMIFSDNVSLEDEAALKQEALSLGRLVMGPDCGTAILAGTPLAFANVVPSGTVGVVGASGTGIQEITCLLAEAGGGISHAVGVGGRDLKSQVGGISTLMAIDALAKDAMTKHIVLVAKPPGADVIEPVLAGLAASGKPTTLCFMGSDAIDCPPNVQQVFTLRDAAYHAAGVPTPDLEMPEFATKEGQILGLYSGGTLAAEAQVILRDHGLAVASNAPVHGVNGPDSNGHLILDLGDDEYTKGRPHPMIDPGVRDANLISALGRQDLAAILLDVVIGYGAHDDPAGHVASVIEQHRTDNGPVLIASVTGTEADPQTRSLQIGRLKQAGVHVAPSNADAAHWALAARA